MTTASSARIHPTALISPEAELGENVEIGPHVVIEGKVKLGPECIIKPFAYLVGPLSMGRGNQVFSGAVIGERPQHMKYNDEPTGTEIGDYNVFREHITIHRGTTHSWYTRIGSGNFFMAHAHVAHDCQIGNRCIFANGALLGGHCIVGDNVYLSGNSGVHQFVRLGRLSMLSGCSATTKDVPPFIIQQKINSVVGINVVGMRRAGMTGLQIDAVKRAFHILFRHQLPLPVALAQIESQLGDNDAVAELIAFLRGCKRGINQMRGQDRGAEAA